MKKAFSSQWDLLFHSVPFSGLPLTFHCCDPSWWSDSQLHWHFVYCSGCPGVWSLVSFFWTVVMKRSPDSLYWLKIKLRLSSVWLTRAKLQRTAEAECPVCLQVPAISFNINMINISPTAALQNHTDLLQSYLKTWPAYVLCNKSSNSSIRTSLNFNGWLVDQRISNYRTRATRRDPGGVWHMFRSVHYSCKVLIKR